MDSEMKDNVMVSVMIAAYNHEKYIRDAIEGVLSQITDFRYELIIHDDLSTDHTREIVREYEKKYPHLIKTIFEEENLFQYGKLGEVFFHPAIEGKYIALCDGDDYWTDSEKLQRQVDFLESHDDYSLCMHNAVRLNCMTGERKTLDTFPDDGPCSQREQILTGLGTDFPASASFVFRTELMKKIPHFFLEPRALDYPIRQYFASCGKTYYFKKPMSVYRVYTNTSYMSSTRKDQTFYNDYTVEMLRFFESFNKYTNKQFDDLLKKKILSDYMGFCSSVSERDGLEKARQKGLDVKKVEECYRHFSEEYLDESIKELSEKCGSLFIYGSSRLAVICKSQLERAGIAFEGFAVSDGQLKKDSIEDKRIFYLGEVLEKYDNPGFILAVQPVNVDIIVNIIKESGIENFCMPYSFW